MKQRKKKTLPKRGYQIATTKHSQKRKKRLRDFKANNVPESIARDGIIEEYNYVKYQVYFYWLAIILGFILLLLNLTDSSLSIEFGSFKYGGTLIGLPLMAWGIYQIQKTPKPKIDLKNVTKE